MTPGILLVNLITFLNTISYQWPNNTCESSVIYENQSSIELHAYNKIKK